MVAAFVSTVPLLRPFRSFADPAHRRGVWRRGSGGARLRPEGIEVLGPRHHPRLPSTASKLLLSVLLSSYDQELKEMEEQSREEYIGSLRRKSTCF
nr:uncharacterized protein LOC109750142 isoform X4 [Aegilops tauschii subsp. strangulata]